MPETPTENRRETREEAARRARKARQARLLVLAAILLAVAVVVVVVVLLVSQGDDGDASSNGAGDGIGTDVTSPYDVHELPADTGPGNAREATLVSIALMNESGTVDYYGLSSDTEPAEALMKAAADADEIESSEVPAEAFAAAADSSTPLPTITFLFEDRGTLAFDLYIEQDIIARGGRFWQVDGDLSALIDAAVSYQQQR